MVLFVVSVAGWFAYRKYDGQLSRIPGLTAVPGTSAPPAPEGARNILMVGSDSRASVGASFGSEKGQRSDTIILAHLYGDSDKAQLVSFPRDSYVTIPAYEDPKTHVQHPAHMDKINAAFSDGGPQLLKATVEALSGIRVDNYVQIDFAGFQAMVDELDGVEVCLLNPVKESHAQIDLQAGRQTIRGAQALAFVRQRYGLPNGDLDRIRRQQAFIGSVTRKALSSGTLLNPVKLNGFLGAVTRSVQVDESLSGTELTAIAARLRTFSAGGVGFRTLPYASFATRGTQSVVLLDDAKVEALFDALRRDVPPGGRSKKKEAATGKPLSVRPAEVEVLVLNGAGVSGLAGRAAADLEEAGFALAGAPADRGTGASDTVVRYGRDRAEAARTLAAAVPGSALQLDATLTDHLELVVGSSYSGVTQVEVGTVPSSAPSSVSDAADPAQPSVTADQTGCIN